MWKLTGFADEIAEDLGEQIVLLNELGVRHVEFRSAWGAKVLDLTPEQLKRARTMLDEAGIQVSSVGSDLGKILVTDPFEPHLERARHAMEVAKQFGAPYIRLFSFFIAEGDEPAPHRDEVLARTRAFVELAEDAGVTLLHENEKDIFGDVPDRVADLLTTVDSPHYRGIFDPANYVQCGVRPVDEAYPQVRQFIDYVHVKDASATELDAHGLNVVLPAGEGDGQWRELIAALQADGYDGFLSLEPHLGDFSAFGALSGPDNWRRAHAALTGLLREQDIPWE